MTRVRLFAALRELAGSTFVDSEATDAPSLIADLGGRFGPRFADIAAAGSVVVNGERADAGERFEPGDDVALLPPVSGG